ncbi:MAG: HAMP domain-containing sensor histidine kinase [Candidatus Saccharimonadales bacterium]
MPFALHKGSIRLAGLYLAIIMSISIFFSVTIYSLSINELGRGLRGPRSVIVRPVGPGFSEEIKNDILRERSVLYTEAKERVLARLIVINIFILIGGGALSYYLAVRTLKPIEEAREAQNRFTADASHELRTPITAMLTENEVTLMDPKLSLQDAKRQLASNIEELQRLSALSDGLMRIAGLENRTLQKMDVSLQDIVDNAIHSIQTVASAKFIDIDKHPKKSNVTIHGDSFSLQEVFTILLDNAVKYSNKNTKISVNIQKHQNEVTVDVVDKGMGIPGKDVPYIFDRFYRADSSRTHQSVQGHGLGLSIAKDIITKHGGTISVKSTPKKGSVFSVRLPLVKD